MVGYHLERGVPATAASSGARRADALAERGGRGGWRAAARGALRRGDAPPARGCSSAPPRCARATAALLPRARRRAARGRAARGRRRACSTRRSSAPSEPATSAGPRAGRARARAAARPSRAARTEHGARASPTRRSRARRDGDDLGQCRAWRLRALDRVDRRAASAEADDAWARRPSTPTRAGDDRERFAILGWRASAAAFGPMPVAEAIARCDGDRRAGRARSPVAVGVDAAPARAAARDARRARRGARADRRGATRSSASSAACSRLIGHHEAQGRAARRRARDAAEARCARSCERLEAMGERGAARHTAAMLAQARTRAGPRRRGAGAARDERALRPRTRTSSTQAIWRGVRAQRARPARRPDGGRGARPRGRRARRADRCC